jgi:hypothetical protein
VRIEVRTGGPSGLRHHEFLPGQPASARLPFVRETFDAADVQWRARYTVSTANGPVVDGTDFRPAGPTIEISRDTLGLSVLRFAAEPEVFDRVAAIEVGVGARTLKLTRSAAESWAVGRRPPATVRVAIVTSEGDRRELGDYAIGPLGLRLDPAALGIGEMMTAFLSAPSDLENRAAYLAVQADDGPWRTLDRDGRHAVLARRNGRWEPPRVKYRTRHVPRDEAGVTSPIAESEWREGAGETIVVEI